MISGGELIMASRKSIEYVSEHGYGIGNSIIPTDEVAKIFDDGVEYAKIKFEKMFDEIIYQKVISDMLLGNWHFGDEGWDDELNDRLNSYKEELKKRFNYEF